QSRRQRAIEAQQEEGRVGVGEQVNAAAVRGGGAEIGPCDGRGKVRRGLHGVSQVRQALPAQLFERIGQVGDGGQRGGGHTESRGQNHVVAITAVVADAEEGRAVGKQRARRQAAEGAADGVGAVILDDDKTVSER